MALSDRIDRGPCVDAQRLADQLVEIINILENAAGSGLSPGCGTDITAGVISVVTDGVTIDCVGGQLEVLVDPGTYLPGDGLSESPANTFNVNVDGTTIEIDGDNNLHVIGGGGGDPWTGWPDPDPSTGLSPIVVAVALINHSGGYTSADTSLAFDGAVASIGTISGPTGTATNEIPRAHVDNGKLLVMKDNDGAWKGFKLHVDVALVTVNQGGGVYRDETTFPLDGFTAICGAAASTGTATNPLKATWEDNQKAVALLADDGNWVPIPVGDQIYSGELISSVPPSSSLDDCVRIMRFNDSTNWFDQQYDGLTPIVVGAINRGPQTIRGSESLPTPVWGKLRIARVLVSTGPDVYEDRPRLELITTPLASTYGHVTTTPDGKPQGPSHVSGSDDYSADGGPCNEG
jgi:hypothetical protein